MTILAKEEKPVGTYEINWNLQILQNEPISLVEDRFCCQDKEDDPAEIIFAETFPLRRFLTCDVKIIQLDDPSIIVFFTFFLNNFIASIN